MDDPTPRREDAPEERSLGWGWVGSLAVIALAIAVLVGAAVRTSGSPACRAYSSAGWLLTCPWVRGFLADAVVLFGIAAAGVLLCGLLVGGVRAAVRLGR